MWFEHNCLKKYSQAHIMLSSENWKPAQFKENSWIQHPAFGRKSWKNKQFGTVVLCKLRCIYPFLSTEHLIFRIQSLQGEDGIHLPQPCGRRLLVAFSLPPQSPSVSRWFLWIVLFSNCAGLFELWVPKTCGVLFKLCTAWNKPIQVATTHTVLAHFRLYFQPFPSNCDGGLNCARVFHDH